MATYLSGQKPRDDLYDTVYYVPSIEQIRTNYPIEFNKINGYEFAYTYIEYIDKTFGWNDLLNYAKTGDFMTAFGMMEQDIYDEWIDYLKENYRRAEE
jgi:hypothetical protein